jgi:hypothetical protein
MTIYDGPNPKANAAPVKPKKAPAPKPAEPEGED